MDWWQYKGLRDRKKKEEDEAKKKRLIKPEAAKDQSSEIQNPMEQKQKTKIIGMVIGYFKNEISYEDLMTASPEDLTGDKDLDEILDLIEHEPKKSGFLGVDTKTHLDHRKKIQELVSKASNTPKSELEFILLRN